MTMTNMGDVVDAVKVFYTILVIQVTAFALHNLQWLGVVYCYLIRNQNQISRPHECQTLCSPCQAVCAAA
jgi:hypothetical protein